MIDSPPFVCWFCGVTTEPTRHGLCHACLVASHAIICANCERYAANRGRGLCGRCYQRLARTGALPDPNLTTPEEVLGERD
jgi:NMD protein affecting ribosome stability and mRNA decay